MRDEVSQTTDRLVAGMPPFVAGLLLTAKIVFSCGVLLLMLLGYNR